MNMKVEEKPLSIYTPVGSPPTISLAMWSRKSNSGSIMEFGMGIVVNEVLNVPSKKRHPSL
jgi:hypothetical protein